MFFDHQICAIWNSNQIEEEGFSSRIFQIAEDHPIVVNLWRGIRVHTCLSPNFWHFSGPPPNNFGYVFVRESFNCLFSIFLISLIHSHLGSFFIKFVAFWLSTSFGSWIAGNISPMWSLRQSKSNKILDKNGAVTSVSTLRCVKICSFASLWSNSFQCFHFRQRQVMH